MTTWILTDVDSDLTGQGSVLNKKALNAASGGTSVSFNLGGDTSDSVAWYTEPNVPNLTQWPAGDYTLSANINDVGADITYVFELMRVSSSGVFIETLGTSGTLSGAGFKSFTQNIASPITTNAGDRLVGKMIATRSASHGNQAFTVSVNNVSADLLVMPDPPVNINIPIPAGSLVLTGQSTAVVIAVFTPVVDAFRFYEDGTEDGSAPIGWDISTAGAVEASFSVAGQETVPRDVAFKSDGTKLYIVGVVNDSVHQYPLSTPWDISTAGAVEASFSVAAQESSPEGMAFKSDGTKLYIVGPSDLVRQYPLSTPWDISTTGAQEASFSVAGQEGIAEGVAFKSDGTKLYVLGILSEKVHQYPLSTPWDISTAGAVEASFSVAGQSGMAFKSDGTKLYITGALIDRVDQHPLSTPWDISTAGVVEATFSVAAEESTPEGIAFHPDGTKLYVVGTTNDMVRQYPLTKRDVATDSKVHLRYLIQEIGGIDGDTGDGYAPQYRKNGGAWIFVTESSANVQVDPNSNLIDGGATTNRATDGISDGTGSFIAGVQRETSGVVAIITHQLTANNFTEHVWAFLLVAADLVHADLLEFRISLNSGDPGLSNTVTPSITVIKPVVIDVPQTNLNLTGQTPTAVVEIPPIEILVPNGSLFFNFLTFTEPTLDIGIPVDAFALVVTRHAPTLAIGVHVPEGNLLLIGQAPTLQVVEDKIIEVSAGSLVLTGNNTTLDTSIPVDTAALILTGFTVVVDIGATITVPAGSLTLTGQTETLDFGYAIPAGSLALTGQTVTLATTFAIFAGSLTLTGFDLFASAGFSIAVDTATLSLTGQTPVIADYWIPTGTLSLVGQDTSLDIGIQVDSGSLSFSGQAPSIIIGIFSQPGAGTLTLTGLAESLTFSYAIDTASLTFTGHTIFTGSVNIPAGSLTLNGNEPTVAIGFNLPAGSLALTGLAPLVGLGIAVQPGVGSVALTGLEETLEFGYAIPTGILTLTTTAPFISEITIPTAELILTGFTPFTTGEIKVQVGQGTLVLEGQVPLASILINEFPDAGVLALTGNAPFATIAFNVYPDTTALILTGYITDPLLLSGVIPDTAVLILTGELPTLVMTNFPLIQRHRVRIISPIHIDGGGVRELEGQVIS